MLDIKFIRQNPDTVRTGLQKLFAPTDIVETLLALDEKRRRISSEVEALRAERNKSSKAIGRTKDPVERQTRIAAVKEINQRIGQLDVELKVVKGQLNDALLKMPNMPHESVPVGETDAENIVTKEWGEKRSFDFKPRQTSHTATPSKIQAPSPLPSIPSSMIR